MICSVSLVRYSLVLGEIAFQVHWRLWNVIDAQGLPEDDGELRRKTLLTSESGQGQMGRRSKREKGIEASFGLLGEGP